MIENDTIRLLRECDAGIKMGVDSIKDVEDYVDDKELKKMLCDCKDKHELLNNELCDLLRDYHDEGKDPNVIAKSMSWIKTNFKMATDGSDKAIADIMIDGCDMGVKSLSKYLNEYKAADNTSKNIAKRLIKLEEDLSHDLRAYL